VSEWPRRSRIRSRRMDPSADHLVAAHPEHRPQRTRPSGKEETRKSRQNALGGLCHLRAGGPWCRRRASAAPPRRGPRHSSPCVRPRPDLGGGPRRPAGRRRTCKPGTRPQGRPPAAANRSPGAQVRRAGPARPRAPTAGPATTRARGTSTHLADRSHVSAPGGNWRPRPPIASPDSRAGGRGNRWGGAWRDLRSRHPRVVTYRVVAAVAR